MVKSVASGLKKVPVRIIGPVRNYHKYSRAPIKHTGSQKHAALCWRSIDSEPIHGAEPWTLHVLLQYFQRNGLKWISKQPQGSPKIILLTVKFSTMCGHQVQISAVFKQWRRINPERSLSLCWPLCRLLFPVPAVTWEGHVTAHITSLSKGHCIKIGLFYATEPHSILPFRWGGVSEFLL